MSNINADRSHRRLVTDPEPNGMCEIGSYVLETHVGINVAGVIKNCAAQGSTYKRCGNTKREAQLEIQDHKLPAAHRYRNLLAAVGIVRGTYKNVALRAGSVQAEAGPQRDVFVCPADNPNCGEKI